MKLTKSIFQHDVKHKSCDRMVQCRSGKQAWYCGSHYTIFSAGHIFNFCFKNAQFYVANLLNILSELFFIVKSDTFSPFLCHKYIMYESGPGLGNERPYRLFDHTDWKSKKSSLIQRYPVFTENIGEEQKKRSSLFVIRPLIFFEGPHFLRGPKLQPA